MSHTTVLAPTALPTVDEWEVDVLAAVLELLAGDDEIRAAMGAAAAEYAQREHGLHRVADAYTAALEQAAGGGLLREAVLRDVARAAAETGLNPEGDALARVAASVRELGLGD